MKNKLPEVRKKYNQLRQHLLRWGNFDPEDEKMSLLDILKNMRPALRQGLDSHLYAAVELIEDLIANQIDKRPPEDKAETKPETQSHVSVDFAKENSDKTIYTFIKKRELSPEVKEAMKKLKHAKSSLKAFLMRMEDNEKALAYLRAYEREVDFKTDQLLNALDKQFMSKEEDKIDTKQDNVDSIDKEESIWKPVSEIPRWNINGFVKFNDSDYLSFGVLQGNYLFFGYDNNLVAKVHEEDRFMSITDFINEHNDMKKRIAKLESIR